MMRSAPPPPPPERDLYVPRKATSEVWRAFRLSRADPDRAWCTVCRTWLTWKKTTSNLLLHCSSWHATDEAGRPTRRRRSPDNARRPERTPRAAASAAAAAAASASAAAAAPPHPPPPHPPHAQAHAQAVAVAQTQTQTQSQPPPQHPPQSQPQTQPQTQSMQPQPPSQRQQPQSQQPQQETHSQTHSQTHSHSRSQSQPQPQPPTRIQPHQLPHPPAPPSDSSPPASYAVLHGGALHSCGPDVLPGFPFDFPGDFSDAVVSAAFPTSPPLITDVASGVAGAGPDAPVEVDSLLANAAATMLVDDMLAPAMLDGRGFRTFAAALRPGYAPPSRAAMLSELESMFSARAAAVAGHIAAADRFSMSVEPWRACGAVFATVLAHAHSMPRPLVLHVHHCNIGCGDHRNLSCGAPAASADARTLDDDACVVHAVEETLRSWKIEESRVVSITSPSELTSRRFPAVQTHIASLHCVLQRAIGQAITRHEPLIIRVCGTIGARVTVPAPSLKAVSCCAGCSGGEGGGGGDWLEWCRLVRCCAKADPAHYIAVQEEIATASSLWSLLRPARKAAEAMLAEPGFLSLSAARYHLEAVLEAAAKVSIGRDIDHAVRGTAFHVAQTISDALSSWRAEDRADTMLLSSLLDPRHKEHALSTSSSRYGMPEEEAFTLLRRHCSAELARVNLMTPSSAVDKEIRAFLALDTTSNGNLQHEAWWTLESGRFPTLALIARKVLAVPSTSAPTGRAFESSGIGASRDSIVTRRRQLCSHEEVSPAYVQTITFLHGNMDI